MSSRPKTQPDCKHPPGAFVPVIDRNRCEGKDPCVRVCPVGVFEVRTLPLKMRFGLSFNGLLKGYHHGWQQAFLVKPDACEACGLCIEACPEDALKLQRVQPRAPRSGAA